MPTNTTSVSRAMMNSRVCNTLWIRVSVFLCITVLGFLCIIGAPFIVINHIITDIFQKGKKNL